jgi:hypothetical protein
MYGILLGPRAFYVTLNNFIFYSSFLRALRTNLPLTSYKILKVSLVFSIETTSITPKGYPLSLLVTPSTLTLASLSYNIIVTSLPLMA